MIKKISKDKKVKKKNIKYKVNKLKQQLAELLYAEELKDFIN